MLNFFLGFAAGVMVAASFWSLLTPALSMVKTPLMPAFGFLTGAFFLWGFDRILPHLHPFAQKEDGPGGSHLRRSTLLMFAITLHNFPEGLAVGVAVASTALGYNLEVSGLAIAIGIGLQNIPEGLAVSMPLRKEGMSRMRSFMYGQASGAVEPVAAIVGAAMAMVVTPLMPFLLSFAAGAMIFVVIEELIPGSQEDGDTDLPTLGFMIGFVVMMFLDTFF